MTESLTSTAGNVSSGTSSLRAVWERLGAVQMIGLLLRHRELTLEMARREITDRYSGQVFGWLWAVGHPLALMGIYIIVFNFIFQNRIGGTREMPLGYICYLLSGLIAWMTFQESMMKGITSITGNANLVKQVVFPIEILPIKGILSAMVTQSVATTILFTYTLVKHGGLFWTHLLAPVLFLTQFLAMGGVCLILSAVGAYFRDLKDFVQVYCLAGMYVMPIFYLPTWVPGPIRPVLYLNPFSYMVWCYQDAFYFGRFEHPWAWPVFIGGSLLLFNFGYHLFSTLKTSFGSVL